MDNKPIALKSETPLQSLSKGNEHFMNGEDYFKKRDFENAEKEYIQAMASSKNTGETAQINFKIGLAQIDGGKLQEGVQTMKDVAASLNYSNIARAKAVEYLGQYYYSTNNSELTSLIFQNEPYKSMYDPKKIPSSYRKLFEYASSFYPLATSELRVAEWYADQLPGLQKNNSGGVNNDKIINYKSIISKKFSNANLDLVRLRKEDPETVPTALSHLAYLTSKLELLGDTSYGSAEEAYKNAEASADLAAFPKTQRAFIDLSYATFLAKKYGVERKNDITILLKPFYSTSDYEGTSFMEYLKNGQSRSGVKENLLLLSSIDPSFKSLLQKLGWTI